MKRYKEYLILAALPVLLSGCSKGLEEKPSGENVESGFEVILNEVMRFSEATKTNVTTEGEIVWTNDTVRLVGATAADMAVVVLGNDATHGFLTKVADEMPEPASTGKAYTAYYPASMFPTATAVAGTGTLPTTYNYGESFANPLKCLPMYAQSSNKVLDFKSIAGLLQLTMTGEMTVTSVVVTSDDPIAGDFEFSPSGESVNFTGSDKKVTINCGDGLKLDGTSGIRFYVPLFEGTYSNLKIKVNTKEMNATGGCCERTIASMPIKKGEMQMSTFKVDRDAVQLWMGGPWFSKTYIGTTSPDSLGTIFMWGDTKKRYKTQSVGYPVTISDVDSDFSSGFSWSSMAGLLHWCDSTGTDWSCYLFEGETLRPEDDAAHVWWGGSWRMLTLADAQAMLNECTASAVTLASGLPGCRITSKTMPNNYIDLVNFKWIDGMNESSGAAACKIYFPLATVVDGQHCRYCGINGSYVLQLGTWAKYGGFPVIPVHD